MCGSVKPPASVCTMRRAFGVFRGYRRASEDDDEVFVRCPKHKVTSECGFFFYVSAANRRVSPPPKVSSRLCQLCCVSKLLNWTPGVS